MSLVGSYEISLEDEYDAVSPLISTMMIPLVLVILIVVIGLAIYAYKRMRR